MFLTLIPANIRESCGYFVHFGGSPPIELDEKVKEM